MADCENCGGGDNNLHRTNPDPAVQEIETFGNIVYHPRRARPWEWCLQKLRNWVTEDGLEGVPVVWNKDRCVAGPGSWPCPEVKEWSSDLVAAPPAAQCSACTDGSWQLWVDTAKDSVATHSCIDGRLVKLGGVGDDDGGCCVNWGMVNGACEPVLVVFSSTAGWRYFDADRVSIPKPAVLQFPEQCGSSGACCQTWTMADGSCSPVYVIYSAAGGWKYFDADNNSITKPAVIQLPEQCGASGSNNTLEGN